MLKNKENTPYNPYYSNFSVSKHLQQLKKHLLLFRMQAGQTERLKNEIADIT